MSEEGRAAGHPAVDMLLGIAEDLEREPTPGVKSADYEHRVAERLRHVAAELEKATGRAAEENVTVLTTAYEVQSLVDDLERRPTPGVDIADRERRVAQQLRRLAEQLKALSADA